MHINYNPTSVLFKYLGSVDLFDIVHFNIGILTQNMIKSTHTHTHTLYENKNFSKQVLVMIHANRGIKK
jgi:hypothetical protein